MTKKRILAMAMAMVCFLTSMQIPAFAQGDEVLPQQTQQGESVPDNLPVSGSVDSGETSDLGEQPTEPDPEQEQKPAEEDKELPADPEQEQKPVEEDKAPPASDEPIGTPEVSLLDEQPVALDPINVTLRIELYGETYALPTEIALDAYTPYAEYGLGSTDPGYFTPLHAMAEYFVDNVEGVEKAEVADHIEMSGNFLMDIDSQKQSSDTSFMYTVNDEFPADDDGWQADIATAKLKDGDEIVVYEGWNGIWNSKPEFIHDSYAARFDQQEISVEAGEMFALSLTGLGVYSQSDKPLADASIIGHKKSISGGAGALERLSILSDCKTDTNGNVVISFDEEGEYVLSAVRYTDYYMGNMEKAKDISRSYCVVTVTPASVKTDAEAVAGAFDALDLGDVSSLTGDVSLPLIGKNGTSVTWESTNPQIVSREGRVNRPAPGMLDETATLTATISKGAEKTTKTFTATVLAYTKEESSLVLDKAMAALSGTGGVTLALTAVEDKDKNILTTLGGMLEDKNIRGVSVAIADLKGHSQILPDGTIVYGESRVNKEVGFALSMGTDSREHLIKINVPAHEKTAQEKIDEDAKGLTFDTIKQANSAPDQIKTNLKLPSYGGNYCSVTWTSDRSETISASGTVKRPDYGQNPIVVTLTATVDKVSWETPTTPYQTKQVPFTLAVPSYTQEEYEASKRDVQAALAEINASDLTEISGKEPAKLTAVTYDLQLLSAPSQYKVDTVWSSSSLETDANRLVVNTYRGKIIRTMNAPDKDVTLTVTVSKSGYSESKSFPLTIKKLTYSELNGEYALLQSVKKQLFDGIKEKNTSPDNIMSTMKVMYRAVPSADGLTWIDKNSGDQGIKISDWTSSNTTYIDKYLKLNKRPACGQSDVKVKLTAQLTTIRYLNILGADGYLEPMPVTLEVTVKAYTNELLDLRVSDGSLEFDKAVSDYTVAVARELESVSVTPVVQDIDSTVTVGGKKTVSGEAGVVTLSPSGTTDAAVVVTSKDGKKKVTTIHFEKQDEAIAKVIDAIFALPKVETIDLRHEQTVSDVLSAYKALTPEQSKLVDAKKLFDAQARIEVMLAVPPLKLLSSEWPMLRGAADNMAVVDIQSPIPGDAKLKWQSYRGGEELGTFWGYGGTPILADGFLYTARNGEIQKLDMQTGEILARHEVESGIGFYSNLGYGDGMIFVPTSNGMIQAFNAETLTPLWVTGQLIENVLLQSLSAILYHDGYVYTGFTNSEDRGAFIAVPVRDMNPLSENEIQEIAWKRSGSYYGAGGTMVGDNIIFGGDDGVLVSADAKTGAIKDTFQTGGQIRCAIASVGNTVYLTTKGSDLYKIQVGSDGRFGEKISAKLKTEATTTPVLHGGKIFVATGVVGGTGYAQAFRDIDLSELSSIALPGCVQSSPVLTTAYATPQNGNRVYLYAALNMPDSSLLCIEYDDKNGLKLNVLYQPEKKQYTMCSPVIDKTGTIYYSNDTGYMFAIMPGKPDDREMINRLISDIANLPAYSSLDASDYDQVRAVWKRYEALTQEQKNRITNYTTLKNAWKKVERLYDREDNDFDDSYTTSDDIIAEIVNAVSSRKSKLSIQVADLDSIDADVFEELKGKRNFTLTFDCSAYTWTIHSEDVQYKNTDLELSISEGRTSQAAEKALPKGTPYTVLNFAHRGAFPGKMTIVYPVPTALKNSEAYSLMQVSGTALVPVDTEIMVGGGYLMFVLDSGAQYVLTGETAICTELPAILPLAVPQVATPVIPEAAQPVFDQPNESEEPAKIPEKPEESQPESLTGSQSDDAAQDSKVIPVSNLQTTDKTEKIPVGVIVSILLVLLAGALVGFLFMRKRTKTK